MPLVTVDEPTPRERVPFRPSVSRNKQPQFWSQAPLWLAAAALFALAAIPLLTNPTPPLADYANHLARQHIIANLAHDPDLARYYFVDWQIVPNIAMDVLAPPLAGLIGTYAAGQVFTVLVLGLLASGTIVFNHALVGRWTLLPLLALPFFYNHIFLVGTLNYLLGIGLALWALSCWIWLWEKPPAARLLASASFVIILFFCHLFAVGIYGLGLLALELERVSRRPRPSLRAFAIRQVWPAMSFIPALVLLLFSPTFGLSARTYWDGHGKFDGILFAVKAYSGGVAAVLVTTLALVGLFAWYRKRLIVHPVAPVLLVLGLVVYVAMPRVLFDSYLADQRLPVALLFMLFGCFGLITETPAEKAGILALAFCLLALRVGEVQSQWRADAHRTLAFEQAFERIDRGTRILVISADGSRGYDLADFWLAHAASLASIEQSALTTRTFTAVGKQVLHVQAAFRNHVDQMDGANPSVEEFLKNKTTSTPGRYTYWHHWPERFDFVFLLFTGPLSHNPDPAALEVLVRGEGFHLYRIRKPRPAPILAGNAYPDLDP